ncbi:efflux RND transporter permease subunit [candidate division WOR-3 bacterium]|nr:efflux RND transporter permease subunit [candidate division WOR-3 bacterium]
MTGFFLKRPVALFSVYAIILVLGIISIFELPLELYPEVSYPKLNITVDWQGVSPETMEKTITRRVESAVFKLKGVRNVVSRSERGTCKIEVEFGRNADMNYQKVLLGESLSQIDFPKGSHAPLVREGRPEEFRLGVPFIISVSGPCSREKMGEIAEGVKDVLERIKGVKKVSLYGNERKVLNIRVVDPTINLYDVVRVLLQKDEAAGEFMIDGRNVAITLKQRLQPEDASIKGVPLKKVASFESATITPYVLSRVNGNPIITLNVEKRRDAGLLEVSKRLRNAVSGIQLAQGVILEFSKDEADEIRNTIRWVGILGIISVIGVSLIFLFTMRSRFSVFIFFLTIFFSSLLTLILLYFSNLSLNLLTISGIVLGFGLLVDNSIIVMENILRRKEEEISEPEKRGAGEVFIPVLAATLTTISVYIPFLFFQEKMRLFYIPFALSSTYALLSSIFVSFTLTPFLSKKLKPVISYSPIRYRMVLRKLIRFRYIVLVTALLLIGGGVYIFNNYVYKGEIWSFTERDVLYVMIRLPSGSRRSEVLRIVERFEEEIKKNPIYKNFYTSLYSRYAWIEIDFKRPRTDASFLKEKLENLATKFANCKITIYGMGPVFFTGGGIMGFPEMSLSGYDYYKVKVLAERIRQKLEGNPRVRNVDINFSWYGKQKEFMLRPKSTISLYGLTPKQISMNLKQEISFPLITEDERVQLKVFKDTLLNLQELSGLPVMKGVKLRDVGIINEEVSPGVITRENQEYRKDIAYEFRGPYQMANKFKQSFLKAIVLPEGFSIGPYSFRKQEEVIKKKEIVVSIILALFLLLVILSSLYESFAKPLLILFVIPVSFLGVSLIYAITEINFDTSAFVGLILLVGIAVNDGIVLIDHLSRGRKRDIDEVIKRAGHRFRPIMITSITSIIGFLPFIFMKSEILMFSKLALSCIGGLVLATIGSLLVLPVVYYIFWGERDNQHRVVGVGDVKRKNNKNKGTKQTRLRP